MDYSELYKYLEKIYTQNHRRLHPRSTIVVDPRNVLIGDIQNYILSEEDLLKAFLFISIVKPTYYKQLISGGKIGKEYYLKIAELSPETIYILPLFVYSDKEVLNKIIKVIVENSEKIKYESIPEVLLNSNEVIDELVKNAERVNFDFLPESVASNEKVQKAFDRKKQIYTVTNKNNKEVGYDRRGYDIEWNDKEGKLIKFFSLPGNFKIRSKEDYIKIVEEYKNSNLSIPAFCGKYYISDVEGFRSLIERLKNEKVSEEESLSERAAESSKKFMENSKKVAEAIIDGKITFEEWINEYYNPYQTIPVFVRTLKQSEKDAFLNTIADQTISYITDYENELRVDKLSTLYTTDYKSRVGGDSKLSMSLWKFLREYSTKPVNFKMVKDVCNIVTSYSLRFNQQDVPQAMTYAGVRYEVTKDKLDEVYAYIDSKNLVCCPKTFKYYLREILTGKIDYSEPTKDARKQLIDEIILLSEKLKEEATVDKYLEAVRR